MQYLVEKNLVYSLKQDGWCKGKPVMCNDFWITINGRTEKENNEMAQRVSDFLNKDAPRTEDQPQADNSAMAIAQRHIETLCKAYLDNKACENSIMLLVYDICNDYRARTMCEI